MTRIYHADKVNSGQPQLVLENDLISVVLLPELGGRILDIEVDGDKFLHRTYPKSVQFGPYVEHGGMEECIGAAPGTLWKALWRTKEILDGVILSTISSTAFSKILLQKRITLDDTEPILKIEYSFINLEPKFNKFTFGIHPEISLGDNFKQNEYYIPVGDGILTGKFVQVGYKQFVVPSEGWCAVTYDGKAYAQLFPKGVIDNVEIYYPKIGTHFILQPIIWGVGLSPNRKATFTYWIYAGNGDARAIKEMYERKSDELVSSYEPIEPPGEREISEREQLFTQRRPMVSMPFEEFGQLPQERLREDFLEQTIAPQQQEAVFEVERRDELLAEVRRRAETTRRTAQRQVEEIDRNQEVEPTLIAQEREPDVDLLRDEDGFVETEEFDVEELATTQHNLAREHFSFHRDDVTEIKLSSISGTTTMEAWDEPRVDIQVTRLIDAQAEGEFAAVVNVTRPEVTKNGTSLRVRSTGGEEGPSVDYLLKMPKEMSSIEINFVSGDVYLTDIMPAHLKIDGVTGTVEIIGDVAAGSEYDVNSVNGEIILRINQNANCKIEATTATGDLNCDLKLSQNELQPNRISGILNENKANISLNTVRGNVQITAHQ